jgi:NitT/TauT family transport system substrate-binding protein
MPQGGPETVLAVLSRFSQTVRGRQIDLARTYTSEFVRNVAS